MLTADRSNMNRERWQKVDAIFKSALELPTAERAAFVERASRPFFPRTLRRTA